MMMHHRSAAPRLAQRAGFSLIEVILAMVMLVIVLTSLAGLSAVISMYGKRNAGRAYENGLLTQEVDRAVAAPIESLAVKLGTTTLDTPITTPWKYERLIAVNGRADSLTVQISIRPINTIQRQDSVSQTVLRTR